jgi:hypothetical protein
MSLVIRRTGCEGILAAPALLLAGLAVLHCDWFSFTFAVLSTDDTPPRVGFCHLDSG